MISGQTRTAAHGMHLVAQDSFMRRFRYQLPIGIIVTALFPAVAYHSGDVFAFLRSPASINTAIGASAAFLIALLLFRRVISFPGIGIVAHVLPAAAAGYGLILAGYLGLRLYYSGITLAIGFVACCAYLLLVSSLLRSMRGRRFYVVPSASTTAEPIGGFQWMLLDEPVLPEDPHLVLIADLHASLDPAWEKLIAEAAVAGHPVYHIKQVRESLTGKVNIEHLSENSFGSLIPNLGYRKIKRLIDVVSIFALSPLIITIGMIVALVIRMDSRGSVFYVQQRRGYRNHPFTIVKFRTMIDLGAETSNDRQQAVTLDNDRRITRVGRFLRRSRLDELPQVWNVLRGEMSWIGPRPEAMPLSAWYDQRLPFYSYRHIVRPGITGWAQVNQGHVADLDAVFEKLQFDFYYIKNFSAWLDLLIVWRTALTMLSGFGAR